MNTQQNLSPDAPSSWRALPLTAEIPEQLGILVFCWGVCVCQVASVVFDSVRPYGL